MLCPSLQLLFDHLLETFQGSVPDGFPVDEERGRSLNLCFHAFGEIAVDQVLNAQVA